MSEITIRKATLDDCETIVGFNQNLASETEDKHLDGDVLTKGVSTILGDDSKGEYFVAVDGDAVIGQIMYTREWSDWRNGELLWLQSVYVAQSHRQQGVFRQLLGHVQSIADSNPSVAGIRLYVERDNTTAQATYTKSGFKDPGYVVMESLRG